LLVADHFDTPKELGHFAEIPTGLLGDNVNASAWFEASMCALQKQFGDLVVRIVGGVGEHNIESRSLRLLDFIIK